MFILHCELCVLRRLLVPFQPRAALHKDHQNSSQSLCRLVHTSAVLTPPSPQQPVAYPDPNFALNYSMPDI